MSAIMWKVMSDMADLLIEQSIDEPEDLDECYDPVLKRTLRCRQCGKRNLNWQKIKNIWTMFESSGKVHICGGYEPPIEVLKEIARGVLDESRKNEIWKLHDKAKKRGGLSNLINILTNEQLVELYTSFIRDECRAEMDMGFCYKKEIKILNEEILRRINK